MAKRLVITPKELEAVHRLDSPKRCSYFIKRVADWQFAWGLWNDGWALALDGAEGPALPLWPALEYAAACSVGAWAAQRPKPIELDDMTFDLRVRLQLDCWLVRVFPTPTDQGLLLRTAELANRLRAENDEWY